MPISSSSTAGGDDTDAHAHAQGIPNPSSASTLPMVDRSLNGLPTLRRRFRPLDPDRIRDDGEEGRWDGVPELKGIVFDVDGTLCEPQTHMFNEMRRVLSIPKTVDILAHIHSLPTPQSQRDAFLAIETIERRAMLSQSPSPGLAQLFRYLALRNVSRKAILTRNFMRPVQHLLDRFLPDHRHGIDPVLTRDFWPPKPRPEGLWEIARVWGLYHHHHHHRHHEDLGSSSSARNPKLNPVGMTAGADGKEEKEEKKGEEEEEEENQTRFKRKATEGLIMVGDSIDDMAAGRAAGAATVLLAGDANTELRGHVYTDLVIERLDDLMVILDEGFVGRGPD